jgi:1,4-alpha-glucan branching enzyme
MGGGDPDESGPLDDGVGHSALVGDLAVPDKPRGERVSISTQVDANSDTGQALVVFRLPRAVDAEQVCVVGEFNEWSPIAHPMEREGDAFVAQFAMTPGRSYRFRYLLDGERWENDWAADAYVPNEFGGDDSVIDLTDAHATTGRASLASVGERP